MTDSVVVLGAGYAGTATVTRIQDLERDDLAVHWIDETATHLVRHEVHRAVRQPAVSNDITVPIEDIATTDTTVTQGTVVDVDTERRRVSLADGSTVDYDYLVVAIGSDPEYYGIDGLVEHAISLSALDDALAIHEAIEDAMGEATASDPAQVVVGGGGLSGIQTAGEIAAFRDEHDAPIEITLVEALRRIFPNGDDDLRAAIEATLADVGVRVLTNDPIVEAKANRVHFAERDPIATDVLVWTGGIRGQAAVGDASIESNNDRLLTGADFKTSDGRVFAVGDSALVETADGPAPPTAQAAIQAGAAVADNVVKDANGSAPTDWSYTDRGTLVSVGERALANDVLGLPTGVVGGAIARTLKKGVAAQWIASVTSWSRALRSWQSL
jgi:NADH dehydrogenase